MALKQASGGLSRFRKPTVCTVHMNKHWPTIVPIDDPTRCLCVICNVILHRDSANYHVLKSTAHAQLAALLPRPHAPIPQNRVEEDVPAPHQQIHEANENDMMVDALEAENELGSDAEDDPAELYDEEQLAMELREALVIAAQEGVDENQENEDGAHEAAVHEEEDIVVDSGPPADVAGWIRQIESIENLPTSVRIKYFAATRNLSRTSPRFRFSLFSPFFFFFFLGFFCLPKTNQKMDRK